MAATLLRFGRLGHWGFDSDEIFMLRDSLHPRLTNPRPLLYLLNHYVVLPIRPLDELGLRLLPAIFGILAIPAFYWATRRLLGTPTALFGSLLVTVSGVLVNYSQFGRYWSLVFLLSCLYPYALFMGFRERNWLVAVGIATGVLAAMAHPTTVLLAGGPLVWAAVVYLRPQRIRMLWAHPKFRWGAGLVFAITAAILVRFSRVLQGWISSHDANPGSGQFLLRPAPVGLKQLFYVVAFAEGLTIPVALTALIGIYLLWQGRDRFLALFLVSLAAFPLVFLTVISIRTPVSTYYLLPTAPVYFMGAGYFLDRVRSSGAAFRPTWLLPAAVTLLVLIPGMPTLISQYLNGRRYDFKGVAQWLRPRLTPADAVFSDQPVALAYYLPALDVQRLRYNTAPLAAALTDAEASGSGASLWIVAPAPDHAFRTNLSQGGLAGWMHDHCQLRASIGTGRVDYRQQYLEVYQCPARGAAQAAARYPRSRADEPASGRDAGDGGATGTASGMPLLASNSR